MYYSKHTRRFLKETSHFLKETRHFRINFFIVGFGVKRDIINLTYSIEHSATYGSATLQNPSASSPALGGRIQHAHTHTHTQTTRLPGSAENMAAYCTFAKLHHWSVYEGLLYSIMITSACEITYPSLPARLSSDQPGAVSGDGAIIPRRAG